MIAPSSATASIPIDKSRLRRRLRAQRRALSRFEQRRAAIRLQQRAMRLPWFSAARSVALYFAADGEIDPMPLLRAALAQGKRVYVPGLRGRRLVFLELRPGRPLRKNRFGIAEPCGEPAVPLRKIDVVCLPLVGFDRGGGRLGMGGGFYDRTFARRRVAQPRLIGLAHSVQECECLPREPWDIPLWGVLTEREWIRATSSLRFLSPASR